MCSTRSNIFHHALTKSLQLLCIKTCISDEQGIKSSRVFFSKSFAMHLDGRKLGGVHYNNPHGDICCRVFCAESRGRIYCSALSRQQAIIQNTDIMAYQTEFSERLKSHSRPYEAKGREEEKNELKKHTSALLAFCWSGLEIALAADLLRFNIRRQRNKLIRFSPFEAAQY
jgi:hypothetical protein